MSAPRTGGASARGHHAAAPVRSAGPEPRREGHARVLPAPPPRAAAAAGASPQSAQHMGSSRGRRL